MNDMLSVFSNSNEQMLKLIISIIAILFIVSIVRSIFRLVMPIVIIGLVMVVFLGFTPNEVINKGKQFVSAGTNFFLENILPYIDPNNESLIDRDGKGNDISETLPENKPFIEEGLKRFFHDNEENKENEIFDEPRSDDSLNTL
ncbi:hypothetical protein JMM81_07865 [Bacillus sp. V3B]|uniref:hypothetical protein n=1 Tax=Bacillus sp. V3B TaxID=2804915 RepID=UPI00210A68D4|nr:hypothetical protein [Bacillus sp. V3B]MCQ6274879.1 hypothetical protein [Bacillus sp. V3B]